MPEQDNNRHGREEDPNPLRRMLSRLATFWRWINVSSTGIPFEEDEAHVRRTSNIVTGIILLSLVLSIVVLTVFTFFTIGEREEIRDWNYGALPYVPAESYTSTEPAPSPRGDTPPRQIELPPDRAKNR